MRFRCAAGRLDGTWYPRCGLKRENIKYGLVGFDRSSQRPHRSPVLTLVSGVPQRSCTSGKKSPSTPSNGQICMLVSPDAEVCPSYFLRAQDRHAAPVRSSHLSLRAPPCGKKTAPAARPGAKVSAAPPGAPPRDPRASPDHSTWWVVPPGAYHGQGGEKTAQFGPWVLPPKPKS